MLAYAPHSILSSLTMTGFRTSQGIEVPDLDHSFYVMCCIYHQWRLRRLAEVLNAMIEYEDLQAP